MVLDCQDLICRDIDACDVNVAVVQFGVKMLETSPFISIQKNEPVFILIVVNRVIQFYGNVPSAGRSGV
jgi:hypothetical protein